MNFTVKKENEYENVPALKIRRFVNNYSVLKLDRDRDALTKMRSIDTWVIVFECFEYEKWLKKRAKEKKCAIFILVTSITISPKWKKKLVIVVNEMRQFVRSVWLIIEHIINHQKTISKRPA